MNPTRSRRRTLAAYLVTLAALLLGGCFLNGESRYLGRDDSRDIPILERGSFEDARARLDTMVDEMAAAMTDAFPDCPMTPDGEGDSVFGSDGGKYEELYHVWPYEIFSDYRAMPCPISDTRERADTAIEVITIVAEDYGFQPPITFNDRIAPHGKGSVAFEGWNTDGDKYSFGSSAHTIVSYSSAPRYTAEQLAAIKAGQTPPQPQVMDLETATPTPPATTLETPEPSPTPEAFPDDTTRDRSRHGMA